MPDLSMPAMHRSQASRIIGVCTSNRAARLEPVTLPGQVYATQPFVALLALEESIRQSEAAQSGVENHRPLFKTAYVGRLALSKNFGREKSLSLPAQYDGPRRLLTRSESQY